MSAWDCSWESSGVSGFWVSSEVELDLMLISDFSSGSISSHDSSGSIVFVDTTVISVVSLVESGK